MKAFLAVACLGVALASPALRAHKKEPVTEVFTNALQGLNTDVGFDEDSALRFLLYSYAAYLPTDLNSQWDCSYCTYNSVVSSFTWVNGWMVDDNYAYIGYNSAFQEIIISFRGSSNLENWIEDLKFLKDQTGWGNGNVATGFYEYYMSLQPNILPALASLTQQFPGYVVYCTGHSLGAAGATLCAYDLKVNQGYGNVQVLNFGSPRVGDSDWANGFNSNLGQIMRMVHQDDIVPHLPPEIFGFQHETQEVWENQGVYNVCDPNNGEDPNCSDSVSVLDFSISDHTSYMEVACCNGP